MATTTHFKLGLLALVTLAALVVSALLLGLRRPPQAIYYTYFDESVQGLEVGAQVKYRGVPIGAVAAIELAPDRRHVAVELEIERDRVRDAGLTEVAPWLRTQLILVGITGLKLVEIDHVDPARSPPPELTFPPREPYIPSRPSLLRRVELGVQGSGDRLPELVDRLLTVLDALQAMIGDIRSERIPQRVASVVDTAGAAVTDLRRVARGLERADVADKLTTTVDSLARATTRLDQLLARVDGEKGLVASAQRATESVGELGRSTRESTAELERTLRDIGDAARAVGNFMDQLERQPEMLLRGRQRSRQP